MDDPAAGTSLNPRDIPDLWPRLIASPLLGALTVNLSGLIDHNRHSIAGLIASYAWFAVVAFVIWQGNRELYFRLPRREDWLLRPWTRLRRLLTVIGLYTIPVAATLLWLWRLATGDYGTREYSFATALLAIVSVVIAIVHVYETAFLVRDWESARLRNARIEQARLRTELESLGREVDPHFLFNNLNALAHLVDQRSELASRFITALSATYRYLLEQRGRALVSLAEELESLQRHLLLAEIRYSGHVRLDVCVPAADSARFLLPPVTLAELFQNALKHNTVDVDHVLHVRVRIDGTTLVFENDLRARPVSNRSTGIGLTNLSERFQLATGRHVVWGADRDCFVVRLPLT